MNLKELQLSRVVHRIKNGSTTMSAATSAIELAIKDSKLMDRLRSFMVYAPVDTGLICGKPGYYYLVTSAPSDRLGEEEVKKARPVGVPKNYPIVIAPLLPHSNSTRYSITLAGQEVSLTHEGFSREGLFTRSIDRGTGLPVILATTPFFLMDGPSTLNASQLRAVGTAYLEALLHEVEEAYKEFPEPTIKERRRDVPFSWDNYQNDITKELLKNPLVRHAGFNIFGQNEYDVVTNTILVDGPQVGLARDLAIKIGSVGIKIRLGSEIAPVFTRFYPSERHLNSHRGAAVHPHIDDGTHGCIDGVVRRNWERCYAERDVPGIVDWALVALQSITKEDACGSHFVECIAVNRDGVEIGKVSDLKDTVCAVCHIPVEDKTIFCHSCRHRLCRSHAVTMPDGMVLCPECAKKVKQCGECGKTVARLGEGEAPIEYFTDNVDGRICFSCDQFHCLDCLPLTCGSCETTVQFCKDCLGEEDRREMGYICPDCGTFICAGCITIRDQHTCPKCGVVIPKEVIREMAACSHCGTHLEQSDDFFVCDICHRLECVNCHRERHPEHFLDDGKFKQNRRVYCEKCESRIHVDLPNTY